MKKLRLILLLMLGMVVSMQAQDITGKWEFLPETFCDPQFPSGNGGTSPS